ncbi:peptide chain release factor N(5)-glutamine methyltransferase [Caldicellulosiruptoraceae bacterium PP1]
MVTKLNNAINQINSILIKNNVKDALHITLMLLSELLNIDKATLIAKKNEIEIDNIQYKKLLSWLNKYIEGYPIQYCYNKAYFMGLEFFVNENVLIPRFDTELIVEKALEKIKEFNKPNVLDIGTGSGAIAITLAKFSDANIFATDISSNALEIAKHNAKINNVYEKIVFIESNLFENINNIMFDIIISNPPYISEEDYKNLDKRVLKEPKIALLASGDDIKFYKAISDQADSYLRDGGYLIFEIGYNQAKRVSEYLLKEYSSIEIFKDLSHIERVIIAKKDK